MSVKYKLKKAWVKFLYKKRISNQNKTINNLNQEEYNTFNMVNRLAENNNANIIFDPYSDEFIINLPKILVIIKNNNITIHNTNGFFSIDMPMEAYNLIKKNIYKEAHKERRKLKYQAKERINNFLKSVDNEAN